MCYNEKVDKILGAVIRNLLTSCFAFGIKLKIGGNHGKERNY